MDQRPTVEEKNYRTPLREKFLWPLKSLDLKEYWELLNEILPPDSVDLSTVSELLNKNGQVEERVLYRTFRLIEGILLWYVHQGNRTPYSKKRNSEHVTKLLFDLSKQLNVWDDEVFQGAYHATSLNKTRDHYDDAARFIISEAATLFTTLSAFNSPDVRAYITRAALALLDEEAEHAEYLRSLLADRSIGSGAKSDTGEDAFYAALTELVAGWTPELRIKIAKQLGDLLGTTAEQNEYIHVPVTPAMARMANLLLAAIRQHNQIDADLTDKKDETNRKKMLVAAVGPQLGTEPIRPMLKELQAALEKGHFGDAEKDLAQQLFESMLIEAKLFNPGVILSIVETFANPELREALAKAYTRKDGSLPGEGIDDVLMYLLTGTFVGKLPNQAHTLDEQDMGWIQDNLAATGFVKTLAKLIKTTAKFGPHTLKGLNPLPQALVFKDPVAQPEDAIPALEKYLAALDDKKKYQPFIRQGENGLRSIFIPLASNRQELSPETRESLKMRLRRWLDVEATLWQTVVQSLDERESTATKSAQGMWSLSFAACANALSEPNSEFFCLEPQFIAEFAPVLAQRLVARYISIAELSNRSGDYTPQKLKQFVGWAINQAAGHWNPAITDAVLAQVEAAVAQNDTHYFSGLIPDLAGMIGVERVAKDGKTTPEYRKENRTKIVEMLVRLLVSFSKNTTVVGKDGRTSLINALSSISGDLSKLAQAWDGSKEYRYKQNISAEYERKTDREVAAIAELLNTLAGHAGASKDIKTPSDGQLAAAQAINTAIGEEIGIIFQAAFPSQNLMDNLLTSRGKLDAQEKIISKKTAEINAAAKAELAKVSRVTKNGKLNLTAVVKLVSESLQPFTQPLADMSRLKFEFKLPAEAANSESMDVYTFLAALTQPYLTGKPSPEVNPLGHVLAQALSHEFESENLAIQPIADLRIKLAQVMNNTLGEPLAEAAELDAERVGEKILAESMGRHIMAADLFMAVKNARFAQEDLDQLEKFFEAVRNTRKMVTDLHGPIERSLHQIRTNLGQILGAATHKINMPLWEDIAWFMNDDILVAIRENQKAAK
jgi:hypothetical protein